MRMNFDEDEAIEVQMAPLIDCVFLLLIFFLVASTLKKIEKELPINLPTSGAAIQVSSKETPFVISVDSMGNTYINSKLVGTDMLHNSIRNYAGSPGEASHKKVRLDIDKNTRGQDIIRILDLCEFEGIRNIAFHIESRDKAAKNEK